MRKFLTVTLVLVFVLGLSGLALAAVNHVFVDQASPDDFLDLDQNGYDNNVRLEQVAWNRNDARISQTGHDNWLGLADSGGGMYWYSNAYQGSFRGYNDLNLTVNGSHNDVGLRQWAYYNNQADIIQNNDHNYLSAYQHSTLGSNLLDVTQNGNDRAEIYQYATSGENNVYVIQH